MKKGEGAGRKEMMFYFFSFMFPIHIIHDLLDSFWPLVLVEYF